MVKIRLARFGKKHKPSYRIVAIQARTKRNGEAIEYLGHYNPSVDPKQLEIEKERVEYWLSVGAQPTKTVHGLLAREGIVKPLKKKYQKQAGRKSVERAEAKAEKAAAAKEAKKETKSE